MEPAILSGSKLAGTETVLELYGPGDAFHAFFEAGPVVGFEVGNFDDARRAMIEAWNRASLARSSAPAACFGSISGVPDGTILEIIGPSAEDGAPA